MITKVVKSKQFIPTLKNEGLLRAHQSLTISEDKLPNGTCGTAMSKNSRENKNKTKSKSRVLEKRHIIKSQKQVGIQLHSRDA